MNPEVIKPLSDTVKRAAQKEAKKSKAKFRHGAVIFKGSRKIISKGFNVHKTCPSFGSGDYQMIHAEGAAIKKAISKGIDLTNASIYVYRVNNNLSKPCPCCQKLIEKYNIKGVFYSG